MATIAAGSVPAAPCATSIVDTTVFVAALITLTEPDCSFAT